MRRVGVVILALVVLVVAFLYFPRSGGVANAADAATLAVVHGDVVAQHNGAAFAPALDGEVLASGDVVRADQQGLAVLTFFDGSTVTVEPGTQLAVTGLSRVGSDGIDVTIEQSVGRTWASVQKLGPGSRFEIKTPTSTAAVRGTVFETLVAIVNGIIQTTVKTGEGTVVLRANAGGSVDVTAGTQASVTQNQPAPNAPTPQAEAPTVQFRGLADGLRLSVTDPRGLACGGELRQIPDCTVAGSKTVTLVNPPGGEYIVALWYEAQANPSPSAQCTAALPLASRSLGGGGCSLISLIVKNIHDGAVADSILTGQLALGKVANTSVQLTASGATVTAGPWGPLKTVLVGTKPNDIAPCGAGAKWVINEGTAAETLSAYQGYASANRGQGVAVVLTEQQLADTAAASAASVSGGPVTVRDVRLHIAPSGVAINATGTAGPLPLEATGRVIAGASSGTLVLRLVDLNAGALPPAAVDQIRSQLQAQLDKFASTFSLSVQRVSFKPGCMAIFGNTP